MFFVFETFLSKGPANGSRLRSAPERSEWSSCVVSRHGSTTGWEGGFAVEMGNAQPAGIPGSWTAGAWRYVCS